MTTATVLYVLNNTDDSQRIVIQPRIFDGAGGVQRNTDLTLYGNGAPTWGERFNENFVRLMENFAVAESGGEVGVPVPNVLPSPKGEIELAKGIGYGINRPVEGQLWFNKSRGTTFVYTSIQSDGAGGFDIGTPQWKPATHILKVSNAGERDAMFPPQTARPGEIIFNDALGAIQVYDGDEWKDAGGDLSGIFVQRDGGNTPMTGALRLHATVPTLSDEASSKFYVDQQVGTRLSLAGGTLTNFLTLHSNPAAGPAGALHAATRQYVDSAVASVDGGVTVHNLLTGRESTSAHTQYLLRSGGLAGAGNNMTGPLVLPGDPTATTHATTKNYVDNLFNSISFSPQILLAQGQALGGTSVLFPVGYNTTNCFIVVSFRGPAYGHDDSIACYATPTGTGWDITCFHKSNAAANYWIFKNGDPIVGGGGGVAISDQSWFGGWAGGSTTVYYQLRSDGVVRIYWTTTAAFGENVVYTSNWLTGADPASNFNALVTPTIGTFNAVGSAATSPTSVSLGTTRSWGITLPSAFDPSRTVTFNVQIRNGLTVLDSANISLFIENIE